MCSARPGRMAEMMRRAAPPGGAGRLPRALPAAAAAFIGIALAAGVPAGARADGYQSQSFAVWGRMDDCAKQAAKQFPDHTPEGNAKREAARLECLRANRLPVNAAPAR